MQTGRGREKVTGTGRQTHTDGKKHAVREIESIMSSAKWKDDREGN